MKKLLSILLTLAMLVTLVSMASFSAAATSVSLFWPANSRTINSYYGSRTYIMNGQTVSDFHLGIDIAGSTGDPIYAAADGTVVKKGWGDSYGNQIILYHPSLGIYTNYAHASQLIVEEGQSVSVGQTIALIGSTGNSSGPHLHFETRTANSSNNTYNPLDNSFYYENVNGAVGNGNVGFYNYSVCDISCNSATISTWTSNIEDNEIFSYGFYFGPSPDTMELFVANAHVFWTNFHSSYNIADYYGMLTPGKTYYYRFYAIETADFSYHASAVMSFTTQSIGSICSFDTISSNNVSDNSATISAWIRNPNSSTIISYGFCVSEDRSDLGNYMIIGKNVRWTDFFVEEDIRTYCDNLKPNTTYYYRFYCLIDGYHFSNIQSFTTLYSSIEPSTESTITKTNPSVMNPTTTSPSETDPSTTEPTVTTPSAIEPTATETKPSEFEPTATALTETDPSTTEPTEPTASLLGDANDDGAVNMKDVLALRKFLAGMDVSIDMTNSDTNEDTFVNMKDVLLMRKFLANLIDKLGA